MPDKLPILRMTHIDNLEFILKNGMWSMMSKVQDPNFKTIGNTDVIGKRKEYAVKMIPPGGMLGEYVPFYFAGHSPMLLNIVTGWQGMTRHPQHDIVFLVCNAYEVMESDLEWCFTDGHAKIAITSFYNKKEDLQKLDWKTIHLTQWAPAPEDQDRMRKKMAEFLVKHHVPVEMIRLIVTYSDDMKQNVEDMIQAMGLSIPVYVDTKKCLYYKDYD